MGELIERSAALKAIGAYDYRWFTVEQVRTITDGYKEVVAALPAVDVAPVVHGKWESKNRNMYGTISGQCSICGMYAGLWIRNMPYKYCPYCGAKMDGEEEPNGK